MKKNIEEKWLAAIIVESYADEAPADPFKCCARDLRAASDPRRSAFDNAEHYLRGLGLSRFPFWDVDQEQQLREWGYNPTPAMVARFWRCSANLLVRVLRANGAIPFVNVLY